VEKLKVGTLIEDMGKLGVISRVITSGTLNINNDIIKWRNNYEIYYSDGTMAIIGEATLNRLVQSGAVKII
jgi:MOSC domain-containing protein YiiM